MEKWTFIHQVNTKPYFKDLTMNSLYVIAGDYEHANDSILSHNVAKLSVHLIQLIPYSFYNSSFLCIHINIFIHPGLKWQQGRQDIPDVSLPSKVSPTPPVGCQDIPGSDETHYSFWGFSVLHVVFSQLDVQKAGARWGILI